MKRKNSKGVTLVALVVSIIVMLIIASIAISLTIGQNGIFNQSRTSAQIHNKEEAKEVMNMKITALQMKNYIKEQELPTLQELADGLCEDEEMEYICLESKRQASLDKIVVGKSDSIFTKIKKYPYEFEINAQLQVASIDGIKIASSESEENVELKNKIKILEAKNEELLEQIATLTQKQTQIEFVNAGIVDESGAISYTYNATKKGKIVITLLSCRGTNGVLGTFYCKKNNVEMPDVWYNGENDVRRMKCYIIEVEEGDVISIYANAPGTYCGENAFSMYFAE